MSDFEDVAATLAMVGACITLGFLGDWRVFAICALVAICNRLRDLRNRRPE